MRYHLPSHCVKIASIIGRVLCGNGLPAALAVGDDLGGPGVGTEQHDEREDDAPSRRRRRDANRATVSGTTNVRGRHWPAFSPSIHRQDPAPGPNAGARLPARPIRPQHAATLGAVWLEQFEHAGIVAARLAGEVPADRVREVEVTGGHGVVVAEHRTAHHADRPWTDAGDEEQLRPPPRRRPSAAHSHSRWATRATATSVRARLTSMPSGWNHHVGIPASRSGLGGRSRPGNGPGAGSPSRRASRAHWRTASPAVMRWAITVGSRAWYRSPLAPAAKPGRTCAALVTRRMVVGRSVDRLARGPSSPAPRRPPSRRRGPTRRRQPAAWARPVEPHGRRAVGGEHGTDHRAGVEPRRRIAAPGAVPAEVESDRLLLHGGRDASVASVRLIVADGISGVSRRRCVDDHR